jgi:hypothetical protein
MTERTKEWIAQWLSPPIIMGILGWLVLAFGAWYRLGTLEGAFVKLSIDVQTLIHSNQEAEKESIRTQDKVSNAMARIESLERFREAQTDYNASTMAALAVLKKDGR